MTNEERRIDLQRKWAAFALSITTFTFGLSLGLTRHYEPTVEEPEKVIIEADYNFDVDVDVEEHDVVEEAYEEPAPEFDFTEAELEYFAKIIYAEYGTSREGMLLCGSVILNRIKSSKFPNDLVDVIQEPNAFSTAYTKKEPSDEAMEVAKLLMMDGSLLPLEVCYFKLYEPVVGTVEYTRVGKVVFSYEEY